MENYFKPHPHLAGYRYSPYPMTMNAAVAAPATGANPNQAPGAGAPGLAPPVASPYQGYNLTNVDMSTFQGVDWGSMYGVGMYV
ncbi:hypothetical protein JTB14_037180 [Gonioctena quinquepunctata]|nr:hypothetical protein JTB14_037180 [Gonioctena quinquepunctata]